MDQRLKTGTVKTVDHVEENNHLSSTSQYSDKYLKQNTENAQSSVLEKGLNSLDKVSIFEHAITCAGFGKFNYSLMALCGLINLSCYLSITVISFILPSAQCDFNMSSSDKGLLNATMISGMLSGAYLWGFLADTYGRKKPLMAALLMDGIFSLISSFLTFYWPFLICSFFCGFGNCGYMGIFLSYLGEFQPKIYREKVLSWTIMFGPLGSILLPLAAWTIIPLTVNITFGAFRYSSWNLFRMLCSFPTILSALWLTRFPESPRFFLDRGEFDEALDCLKRIYTGNTGDPGDAYPIKSFDNNETRCSVISVVGSEMSIYDLKTKRSMDLKNLPHNIWCQTKELFKPPHLKNITLTCLIQLAQVSSYYSLVMWFPELFNRFEKFESKHLGSEASVCQVSSVYIERDGALNTADLCGSAAVGESVYTHTLWTGIAYTSVALSMPLFVHRLGAKFILVMALMVSGVTAAALYFVKNSLQNLILSCIYVAFNSLGICVMMCIMVDLFPTNIRVMAVTATATVGRLGSIPSSIIFGLLIDSHCILLIVVLSSTLLLSSLLALALPYGDSKNSNKPIHA